MLMTPAIASEPYWAAAPSRKISMRSMAAMGIAFKSTPVEPRPIVGRESALRQMSHAFARAREGERQVLFVTGEPGIGKTALVDAFLMGVDDRSTCRVVRAECVEYRAAGEAYQPLLEALTRLCTQPDSEPYLTALRRCAPTWLAQLPALQTKAERQGLRRRSEGATPERMLRELTDAFEAMTSRSSIVLCLEDLHWSDPSTLDWIASFARRPDAASVLVIGTYRPGEAVSRSRSPEALASGLEIKGLCTEMALDRLDAQAVKDYVFARFPPDDDAGPSLETVATLIYQPTEGNPLFVVNALTDLIARRVLVARDDRWTARENLDATSLAIPVDVRRTIERQIDRLDEGERRLLEVASITGDICSAAAVAAGAGVSPTEVEAMFDVLARRNAFVSGGPPLEWPDGTLSATFKFQHSLYRDVLAARVSPARRTELHGLIGARLEAAYEERAPELAAELALHFEHGRDFRRAVVYLQHAAETDRSRSAHDVAQHHYGRALAVLQKLPAGVERDEREVALRIGLGSVLIQTSGWAAPEVQAGHARVRELLETRGPARPLLSALWHLWTFSLTHGDLVEARTFADRLFMEAERSRDEEGLLQGHHARWSTLFTLGDLEGTERHAREGLRLCEARGASALAYGGHETGVCARIFRARALALGGRTDTAAALCEEAVTRAREIGHPFTVTIALTHGAAVHETRRDVVETQAYARHATRVAHEHGFRLMRAWATCFLGWSMTHLGQAGEGLPMLREGVASARAAGARFQPHMLGLLASALAANGLLSEALQTVDDAFAISDRTGERFYVAELHRLLGELRLAQDHSMDACRLAEQEFRTAMCLADDQGARQLALRAAVSLAALWTRVGKGAEAVRLLVEMRGTVVEGANLPDIVTAEALIADAAQTECL